MCPSGSSAAMKGIAVWRLVFQTRQYLKGSLWFLPLLGGLVGVLLGLLEAPLDRRIDVPESLQYSASTASTVLSAIVGSTAALTGFVVTVSVLVVQMATNTFSARYMRLWYRDRMLHVLLAMLALTFTFSFTLLAGVEEGSVPNLGITATGVLMSVDLFLFLFFLDRFIHRLRPVAVAALVAGAGRRAFESGVRAGTGPDAPELLGEPFETTDEPTLVVRSSRAGSIQALHGVGLVRFARAHGCTLVLDHAVGDFVPEGAAVLRVYGGDEGVRSSDRRLHGMFVLGVERTIEQDPAFALRIMVDIAIKALSPAVNDPTTAVQVLNHLGDTLRLIGSTDLEPRPSADSPPWRVIVPVRGWRDFLALGVTEIREYGASSVQVARRLRALLEELHGSVRPEHRAAVEDELARLAAQVERAFGSSADLDRAGQADRQGIGGVPAFERRDVLEQTMR
jgi:uncharacterized membrane protein